MEWIERLREGLVRTSANLTKNISSIFTDKKLDEEILEELTDLLVMSDMGVNVASEVVSELRRHKFNKHITDQEIKIFLIEHITKILVPCAKEMSISQRPHVILMCGVNGSGKTTTIGKLAHKLKSEGNSLLFAACDTFRAAADMQLQVWAERVGAEVVRGDLDVDPASVAYKALEKALSEKTDVLIIDTAGRLQNKTNLMEELAKVVRVLKKLKPDVPHDTILVLDATVGQNALSQVEIFKEIVNITGLIVTKLDGTAKAGILVAIAKKFNIPIHLIGIGEKIDDLNNFDPKQFAKSLFGE